MVISECFVFLRQKSKKLSFQHALQDRVEIFFNMDYKEVILEWTVQEEKGNRDNDIFSC